MGAVEKTIISRCIRSDKSRMLERTLKEPLVCWPKNAPKGGVPEVTIVARGERVQIRENEERRTDGRMLLLVGGRMVYCGCADFWKAVR
jgi:hypothetical protein